jgi:hypothetical protein
MLRSRCPDVIVLLNSARRGVRRIEGVNGLTFNVLCAHAQHEQDEFPRSALLPPEIGRLRRDETAEHLRLENPVKR